MKKWDYHKEMGQLSTDVYHAEEAVKNHVENTNAFKMCKCKRRIMKSSPYDLCSQCRTIGKSRRTVRKNVGKYA